MVLIDTSGEQRASAELTSARRLYYGHLKRSTWIASRECIVRPGNAVYPSEIARIPMIQYNGRTWMTACEGVDVEVSALSAQARLMPDLSARRKWAFVASILLYQSPDTKLEDLESALTKTGYAVAARLDVAELDPSLVPELGPIDLAIIDATCGVDGAERCREFSKVWPQLPLILCVAENVRVDKECRGLTGGNVLQFPFTCRKVINRVKKLMSCHVGNVIRIGELALNLETRCVYCRNTVHRLTPRQAKLLEVFIRHNGQTLTRKYLMEAVWETDYMGDTRTLDVHVRWIRERIEKDPGSPKYLRTVRGIGYRFGVPTEADAET